MKLHAQHGEQYKQPGFHSGYNEAIVSAEKINAALPAAVEAFFVLDEGQARNGDGVGVNVGQAHRNFLQKYGLTAEQVPLLKLEPANWEAPFSFIA